MNNTKNNHESRNILVTGGGGFLGKAIVRKLIKGGHKVTSFSRSHHKALDRLGAVQIHGDICDAIAVENACKKMDSVFHVAAKPGVWGSYETFFKVNTIGTKNVIAACQNQKVPILIYTSSPSVIFDGSDMEGVNESVPYPDTWHAHYPETKALAEQAVVNASNDHLWTITLRPHLIWGPEDNHLVPRILARAKKLAQVGDGKNKVDTIYVENAAKAHVLAEEALRNTPPLAGNIYFISDDAPIPLWEMVNHILSAGGKSPVKRCISPRTAWVAGVLLEWVYRTFGLNGEPKMTKFVAQELATSHWFDISAAKKDLGYKPDVSIEEGLERLQSWLKKTKDIHM